MSRELFALISAIVLLYTSPIVYYFYFKKDFDLDDSPEFYLIWTVLPLLNLLIFGDHINIRNKYEKEKNLLEQLRIEPNSVVYFEIKGDMCVKTAATIKARILFGNVYRSDLAAKDYIDGSFRRGLFTDEFNISYPTCNIERVWIEEEKVCS